MHQTGDQKVLPSSKAPDRRCNLNLRNHLPASCARAMSVAVVAMWQCLAFREMVPGGGGD